MKIASMYFLCPILACCLLLQTVRARDGAPNPNLKILSEAEEEFAPEENLQHAVYFKHLTKAHYNWQMKSVYADYSVQSFDDYAGAISQNYLKKGESGSFSFKVSDLKAHRIIGFSPYNTEGKYTSVLVGVIQEGDKFHFAKEGDKVEPLNEIAVGNTLKLQRDGNTFTVLKDNAPIYTYEYDVNELQLHIDLSFGNSPSSFINLKSSFASALDFKTITIQPEGFKGKGSLDVEIKDDKKAYNLWGAPKLLSEQEFETAKSSWTSPKLGLENLTYENFLKSFPLSRSRLSHGRYPTAFTDEEGNQVRMDIDIPSDMRWVGDNTIAIEGRDIVKSGGGNNWEKGMASSDNVFHPGKNGITNFRFNKQGIGTIGLRALNQEQKSSIEGLKYGFSFSEEEAVVVVDGNKIAHKVKYNAEDFFGFELIGDKIYFLKNGSKIYSTSATLDHKSVLDVSLYTQGARFLDVSLMMIPLWPVLEYEQSNSICGKIVQQFTLSPSSANLPRDTYTPEYEWRNENGEVVSNSIELKNVPTGHYKLTVSLKYPSGGGQVFVPVTYLVGYKAYWHKGVEVEHVPKSNFIRNTLTDYKSNLHSGETSNYINPGTDEWIYFEVKAPVDAAGNVSYPGFFDRTYSVDIQSYSKSNFLRAMVYYMGGNNQTFVISDASQNSLFTANVNTGDKVLMKITGGNKLSLSINGQVINSVTSNAVMGFQGINMPSVLGFSASFRSQASFNSKIGPGNVITSFPCADLVYLNLKRQLDGAYYPSRLNVVGFRYLEEYLPASGTLNYKIIDEKDRDVFATHSVAQPTIVRRAGDNKCEIDLANHRNIFPAGYYILEVTNDKQEKRFMRFRLY